MAEEFRVLRPYEYHSQLIAKGKRADGRKLDEVREVKFEVDAIKTADSSSLVKLGNTSLVCGCTASLMECHDKYVDSEAIKITIELPPICSSPTGYRTQNTAQLLTKTLKNILEETNCVCMKNLYLKETHQYWSIDVEVICLNYDGCLLDASLIAVLSALKSLKLKSPHEERHLKLRSIPICSSFASIGDRIIADPNLEEETIAQSTFSITIDPSRTESCHVNKVGGCSIKTTELLRCIWLSKQRTKELHQIIGYATEDKKMDCE